MRSIFDLDIQQTSTEAKIVAGLERIAQVFKVLLWEKAERFGLSPIQIQVLIFIRYHSKEKATVSHLAKEFNVSKATISETIKVLEKKSYVRKEQHSTDSRSQTIGLTLEGNSIVLLTESFLDSLSGLVDAVSEKDKILLWKTISGLLHQLYEAQLIKVQSSCYSCRFFAKENENKYCLLMQLKLKEQEIRLDCREHQPVLSQTF
ncbi:MAG: MarR family transcriptional regulator [Flavobacterium sp.]|nr:MAG: MarR family transcriptional regulator [Flavobacterium sp.]